MPLANKKQKYFAGADSAGGFAVPADYGGTPSETDTVLDEHNQDASDSAKYVQELYKKYEDLPPKNIVRQQAEQYLAFYNQTRNLYEQAKLLLEKQKAAAGVVQLALSGIIQLVNEYRDTWSAEVLNDNSDVVTNEIQTFIDKSTDKISYIISQYEGIEIYDLSVVPIQKLQGLSLSDDIDGEFFAEDGPFDDFVLGLNTTLSRLKEIQENGGGIIRVNFEGLSLQEEKLRESVDDMQDLIQTEMVRTKNVEVDTRLLEELEEPVNTSVPQDVPNYRLAIDASPRVCGNCRFFKGDEGLYGNCTSYDFTARANYICDAWQSIPVPSAKTYNQGHNMRYRSKAEMIDNDGSPEITPGKVPGSVIQPDANAHDVNWEAVDINYSLPQPSDENAVLRNTEKQFLPGDIAYSHALRSLIIIKAMGQTGRLKYYVVDMIDGNGTRFGTGITISEDMTPRSKQAVKRNRGITSVKNEEIDGLDEVISETKAVYQMLEKIVATHADLINNPLSNKDVLSPLREQLIQIMEKSIFQNVRTGQKRKYYRALQDTLYSVGAARHILFSGYKTINYVKRMEPNNKTKIRHVMVKSQKDAYSRLKIALRQVEDALTLPSSMHNMPAPGLKQYDRAKKDLFDVILQRFHDANVAIDGKVKLDEGEYVTQYGYRVWHNLDEDEKEHDILDRMLAAVQSAGELKISNYGTETKDGVLCIYVDIIQVV